MFSSEYYDWNTLIDNDARNRMTCNIREAINTGHFWTNSPKYQTNYNVFGTSQQDFINLKMSFIWSCFAFLNKEVKIHNIQSWAYMTSLNYPEDRDTLWHHHNHNPATKTVSGIYYLDLPDDVYNLKEAGTEMAPDGVDSNNKFFLDWRTGHWLIYPGTTYHRPGILQSNNDRFIIAADLEF